MFKMFINFAQCKVDIPGGVAEFFLFHSDAALGLEGTVVKTGQFLYKTHTPYLTRVHQHLMRTGVYC